MLRVALLLLVLLPAAAGTAPIASVEASAGDGGPGAAHAWSYRMCAGETEAVAQWIVVANDVILSAGYWLLEAAECMDDAGFGTMGLTDCVAVEVSLTPTTPGDVLHAEDAACSGRVHVG